MSFDDVYGRVAREILADFNGAVPGEAVVMTNKNFFGVDWKSVGDGESAVGLVPLDCGLPTEEAVRAAVDELVAFLREAYWRRTGDSAWPPCPVMPHSHPAEVIWSNDVLSVEWGCPQLLREMA